MTGSSLEDEYIIAFVAFFSFALDTEDKVFKLWLTTILPRTITG